MAADGTVLVVDDEAAIADGYTALLTDRYAVRTAYSGEQALEKLDEDVDVVLLDRDMPDYSGDEVVGFIRERDLPCRVALVTGVEPSIDLIDLGFDEYLLKPATREKLHRCVEMLLLRSTYSSQIREYFSLVSKRAVLLQYADETELTASGEFTALETDIERLKRELDELLSRLDQDALFLTIDR